MEELIIDSAKKYFGNDKKIEIQNRLLGGMSSYTYVVSVSKKLYTVRVVGENGNLFVDRKIEFYHLIQASNLELIPKTEFFSIVSGQKISEYIKGEILSTIPYELYLDKIVEVLKKVHAYKPKIEYDYELFNRLEKYEKMNTQIDFLFLKLKEQWKTLYLNVYSKYPKVFCHCDAQRSNFIISDEKLYLTDWEYAGFNDFYYDIASFANIDFNDSVILLERYLGRKAMADEIKHLKFYRMYQALQWHLVAKYKHMIGLSEKLHIDFDKYSKHYLEFAEKLYNEIK